MEALQNSRNLLLFLQNNKLLRENLLRGVNLI